MTSRQSEDPTTPSKRPESVVDDGTDSRAVQSRPLSKRPKQTETDTLATADGHKENQTHSATKANGSVREENHSDPDDDHIDNDDGKRWPTAMAALYVFEGIQYPTYQAMVNAKRERNQRVLEQSGLLQAAQSARAVTNNNKTSTSHVASQAGLQPNGRTRSHSQGEQPSLERRKSKRIAGIQSDGIYVEQERAGRVLVANTTTITTNDSNNTANTAPTAGANPRGDRGTFKGRINHGDDISLAEAVTLIGPKWFQQDQSITEALEFVKSKLQPLAWPDRGVETDRHAHSTKTKTSPKSVLLESTLSPNPQNNNADRILDNHPRLWQKRVDALAVDQVAKVVPDRIYSVATHPATNRLIVAAGDKNGYVGLWHVASPAGDDTTTTHTVENDNPNLALRDVTQHKPPDSVPDKNQGVYLFKYHSASVSCLEWTHNTLFSSSYDGTVRVFDIASERFIQSFATLDDSEQYRKELGYAIDEGGKFWTQYACLDPRTATEQCFFLATSFGTALHVDLRVGKKGAITFHEEWSEKKINTLSLHPNGYSMVSGGLDCYVKLWDLRNPKSKTPLAQYFTKKSVNSAFFSPSGQYVAITSMDNKLEVLENFHCAGSSAPATPSKGPSAPVIRPHRRIPHDNQTGRWLSTFMARFHPRLDLFCVGSMAQPRRVEIFSPTEGLVRDIQGEALTAVASRCCFHPSTDHMILVGGNSSGRVTIIR